MSQNLERAVCRGCGAVLDGKPYYMGGPPPAIPGTSRYAKACHYGGWICSEYCDRNTCLKLERTMPGHGERQTHLDGNLDQEITKKWRME